MKLVIVERAEIAHQLRWILEKEYEVRPCFVPIRKLALHELRVENGGEFIERYVLPPDQHLTISGIRNDAREANAIYIITTPDREGELLAWDISECLPRRDRGKVRRLELEEITVKAVLEALGAARKIDAKAVDAARARRLLDHILEREMSPLLAKWEFVPEDKPTPGMTEIAALRLVAEREIVRRDYNLTPGWTIKARLEHEGTRFEARMDDTADIVTGEEAAQVIERLMDPESAWIVERVERHIESDEAPAPYTNATLLIDAEAFLDLRPGEVQQAAMKLYAMRLITYPITGSIHVSARARQSARDVAAKLFGEEYVAPEIGKPNSQIGLEAIRPVDPFHLPDEVSIAEFGPYPAALYALIWQRFIASVMKPARYRVMHLTIRPTWTGCAEPWEAARAYPHPVPFHARLRSLVDGGYTRIYSKPDDFRGSDQDIELPDIEAGDELTFIQIKSAMEAAPILLRFTPASLVGMLTAMGIGTPRSRVEAIERLLALGWAALDGDALIPTPRGEDALFLYVEHFEEAFEPKIIANLDRDLDLVAEGKADRIRTTAVFFFTRIVPGLEETRRTAGDPIDPLGDLILPAKNDSRKETA